MQGGGYSGGGGGCARSQSAAPGARSKSPRRSLSPPADGAWRYTGAPHLPLFARPPGLGSPSLASHSIARPADSKSRTEHFSYRYRRRDVRAHTLCRDCCYRSTVRLFLLPTVYSVFIFTHLSFTSPIRCLPDPDRYVTTV